MKIDIFFKKYPVFCKSTLAVDCVTCVGTPTADLHVYVLDEKLNRVAKGCVGELYASGYYMGSGYADSTSPENYVENPFSTDPGKYINSSMASY